MRVMKRLFAVLLFVFISQPSIASALFVGPYSGTVTDSQTGEPIEGASIFIYWTKRVPVLIQSHSETITVRLVYTDKEGKYNISSFLANLGLISFFESTNIIIYQPGYQAYIKQIQEDNPYQKPDPSYKDIENMVKLDRIPPIFSHKEHYEKIDHALWGIDSFPYPDGSGQPISWGTFIDRNLKSSILEKEELLQRVEWEERRGMEEYRR